MSARVLVVEDEALIALELIETIAAAGYAITGPATDVARALRLLDDPGCDVAVLDVSLCRDSAAPIAEALRRRNIPFVVVSGYSRGQHPPAFAGAPYLPKPIDTRALVTTLRSLIG